MFQVWEVDPHAPDGQQGCCENQMMFVDMFPLSASDNELKIIDGEFVEPLTGNVDAVFHSHIHRTVYFIRGLFVWENIRYSNRDPVTGDFLGYNSPDQNELVFLGRVNDFWQDICEVNMDQNTYMCD